MYYKNSYKYLNVRQVSEKNAKKLNCTIFGNKLSNEIYVVIDYIGGKFHVMIHGTLKPRQRMSEKDVIMIQGPSPVFENIGLEIDAAYKMYYKQSSVCFKEATRRKLLAMAYDHIDTGRLMKRVVFFIDTVSSRQKNS